MTGPLTFIPAPRELTNCLTLCATMITNWWKKLLKKLANDSCSWFPKEELNQIKEFAQQGEEEEFKISQVNNAVDLQK